VMCAGLVGLKGYTGQGKALRAEVEGFRRFLAQPALLEPLDPDAALARYERYLPYALALGVGRRWVAAHAPARAAAPADLRDMQTRYGGDHDVLLRPRAVMASLDRWAARAAPARGQGRVADEARSRGR